MLSHHPCCVFVAPIAITGTWGPCIVGSFSLISLESIQLLWFYSEVSAFAYMISWDCLNSLSQKTVPVWLWTALWGADSSLVGSAGLDCGSQPRQLLSLPPLFLPLPRWHHGPHPVIPSKKRTSLVQLEKNAAQGTSAKLPWKQFLIVVSLTDMEVILNNKQNQTE